jgi:hypothetical protein
MTEFGSWAEDWLTGSPMDPAAQAPEPLPTIPGFPFLHRGAGAVIVGPTGGGRSSLIQACAYDAAPHGVRVAYLGSEVTEGEFNARAADLARRREDPIDSTLRDQLANVRYLNLASTIAHAWEHPDQWAQEIPDRFDVVAIDPISAVASTLGLDFDKSNAEFVRFYDLLVQPLAAAGVAVAMLDNVGHAIEARARAKGASAKQDRADLTFWCKVKAQPVGLIITAGKVRTVRAPFHRGDAWSFDRATQRIARTEAHTIDAAPRPTVLMERISLTVESSPGLNRTAIRNAVHGRAADILGAVDTLISENYIAERTEHGRRGHHSIRPFRKDDDDGSAVPDPFPSRSGNRSEDHGSPVPALKNGEPGTTDLFTPNGDATCTQCGSTLSHFGGKLICIGCTTSGRAAA